MLNSAPVLNSVPANDRLILLAILTPEIDVITVIGKDYVANMALAK